MIIAIDFDGTCVTHVSPGIGKDIGAVPVLKDLVENGHKLVLFTMRSGVELERAVDWFKENAIELYGIQSTPGQEEWTSSPKVWAQLYIDDKSLGIPLSIDVGLSGRPFVDWGSARKLLEAKSILLSKSEKN